MRFCGVFLILFGVVCAEELCCDNEKSQVSTWQEVIPTWTLHRRIPMVAGSMDPEGRTGELRGKFKVKKKFKRWLLPLLLAYKLKFFTLIPVLIGGLVLLTGATGLAGFFFALFAAVMGLKSGGSH